MHTEIKPTLRPQSAYALLMTLGMVSVCILLLAGICQWANVSSRITGRNNAYNSTVEAAEATTEIAIAQMEHDFSSGTLSANGNNYNSLMPASVVQDTWPANYSFNDGQGSSNRTAVVSSGWQQKTNLDAPYEGLYGQVNTFDITAAAKRITGLFPVSASVHQNVQFLQIPIFQFAIFYSLPLEINPGQPMLINGQVHGNSDIYCDPGSTLTFGDRVSAAGHIYNNRNPNDPSTSTANPAITYDVPPPQQFASSLTLPIGSSNVVQILDPPPAGEDPHSVSGAQRYYNKSDLNITINNSQVTVQYNEWEDGVTFSTVTNAFSLVINANNFISTNLSIYDYREGKQVIGTDIDIAALDNWVTNVIGGKLLNDLTFTRESHYINRIYVNDKRSVSGKLTAVRLKNGQYLPGNGLTVATPQPVYIMGNYNAPNPGSSDTSQTKPASVAADAITVLSSNWQDSNNSGTSFGSRRPTDTTINAALLSGIVESATVGNNPHYSGGVENYLRYLENWSGITNTYNGSMVVLFDSRYATNFWQKTGVYYNAPKRNWAFDLNFLDFNKTPPATPKVQRVQRKQWNVASAN